MKASGPVFPFKIICAISVLFAIDSGVSQNIVELTASQFTANPVRLTDTDVSELFVISPRFPTPFASAEARRVSTKLEAHVMELIDGAPWMPFHQTLGISGYEVYFDHPDELFLALSLALPCLSDSAAERVNQFLERELATHPPYGESGFDHLAGRGRESYEVPSSLRVSGRGRARSALGVYSFWAWCHYAGRKADAAAHWNAIRARTQPLLASAYAFDPQRTNSSKGETQKLNGDLAGLIGLARLARWNNDQATEQQALRRGRELLEWRVNLERTNPFLLEKSDAATKKLHNARLARYCDLVPEVGEALARFSADCGARNLRVFRAARNGWFLAFGDRLIGGENYTNPAHFPRSLFAGAALVERLPGDQLLTFVDVPWCKADLYFIERCALALWAEAGRSWKTF
jgi:hypothetical protein